MSYDIWLAIDTGGPEEATVTHSINYTANVSPMWALALGRPLPSLDGALGADAAEALAVGIAAMDGDRAPYRELSPANGWGTVDGALQYLRDLHELCLLHPKATVRMSR